MDLKRKAMDGALVLAKKPRNELVAAPGDENMDVMLSVCDVFFTL